MSSDKENEYFSDGITEEIINALSKIEGLHVTARTSSFAFKNQHMDVREIGRKLNVALLLEGSIRKSNNTIRITAQLTSADEGFHVWSDSWDRELENIFILQDEIAALIAEKVNSRIEPPAHPSRHVLENEEALDAYLRATYLLNTWDFHQASGIISLFEKAIALDPGLIKAYIGLCNASTWLGSTGYLEQTEAREKIERSIQKVMELDPECPDVYLLLASQHFWIYWDIAASLIHIEKALELRPSSPEALLSKGTFLAASGQIEEAFDCLFQADRLDPYASNIKSGIGMLYGYINEDVKALEFIEANIRIAPYWDAQYLFKVESLCKLKRFDEAWETIGYIESNASFSLSSAELKAHYYACQGNSELALEQIDIMKAEQRNSPRSGDPDSAFFAQLYLILEEVDTALDYIEKGIAERAAPLLFQRVNSIWDPIRDQPRFVKAMEVIRYPEAPKPGPGFKKKYAKSMLTPDQANEITHKLDQHMIDEKVWLNPTLNLADLAESLDISVHLLSQILNEYVGKNFYDFVNTYRLEHFLDLCQKPAYKNFKLLSLAYECGFNSKTTFNAFFRKIMHKTPSEYFKTSPA